MTQFLALAADNLASPPILFFVLGLAAGGLRSGLRIPDPISHALALYLMLAIGFKGGAAIADNGLDGSLAAALVLGAGLSFAMPFAGFALLRATTPLDRATAAATAAHYGSVSVVTFIAAAGFLDLHGIAYEAYLIAVVAAMETPAIVSGLLLARGGTGAGRGPGAGPTGGQVVREVLLNGSVVLLLGAFAIGWATGPDGLAMVAPFVVDPFYGLLCLFLLDMGLVAAAQLRGDDRPGPAALAFAVYMPLIGAGLGLAASFAAGLSPGGTVLLTVLAASASYIAVPAAVRVALPEARAGTAVTLSLAVTFPFNILLGIPLYAAIAAWAHGG